jgi:hypothetical protein
MPMLGIMASAISGNLWAPAGAYDSISSVTLSASASSVVFSGIPATYTHLQLRCTILASAANSDIQVVFNADTASNYSQHYLYGNGASALAGGGANQPFFYLGFNAGDTTYPVASVADVLDYANTNKYKTARTLGGFDRNGSGSSVFTSGSWRNTNAITTLTIFPNTGTFQQYSSFALYGVK